MLFVQLTSHKPLVINYRYTIDNLVYVATGIKYVYTRNAFSEINGMVSKIGHETQVFVSQNNKLEFFAGFLPPSFKKMWKTCETQGK